MANNPSSKYRNIIIVILLLVTVLILFFKSYFDEKSLKSKGIYVIGRIDKVEGVRRGMRIFFSYKYDGVVYNGDYVSYSINKSSIGKKYFFKINPSNPNGYLKIEEHIDVPDSLISPPRGWDEIP